MTAPAPGLRRRAAGALLAAALLATLAACRDGGRATPEATWSSIRAAVSARDPKRLFELHDRETIADRRQVLADWRALLARGDPPEHVIQEPGMTADEVATGSPDEAIGRLISRHSKLVRESEWFLAATLDAVEREGEDAARLRLRGPDGRTFDLWLVLDPDGWAIDHRRTFAVR